MKISKEQVAENRIRILEVGARLFRERGFEGVTVSDVMTAAGLTHGAFYGYFASKDDLIACTMKHDLTPGEGRAALPTDLKEFAAYYLSQYHRDNASGGCMFAALGSEAVRGPDGARHAMTESVKRQIDKFSKTAPGETEEERKRAAIVSWSAMIGAMVVARVVDDPALSDQFLQETKAWLGAGDK